MGDFYAKRKATRAAAKRKEREYSEAAVDNVRTEVPSAVSDYIKEAVNNIGEQWDTGTNKLARGAREVYQGAVEGYRGDVPGAFKEGTLGASNVVTGGLQALMSPVSGPVEAALPNLGVTEAAMKYVDGTKAGQLMRENPRGTEGLFNLAEIASLGRLTPRVLNSLADNAPTKMEGFYSSPNPLNKVTSAAKAVAPNTGNIIDQLVNPYSMATRDVIGTGQGRRNEYVSRPNQSETAANMLATGHMDTQMKGGIQRDKETVAGSSAEAQRYIADEVDISDTDGLKRGLQLVEDAPDNVLEGAVAHVRAIHGTDNSPGNTSVVIRKPNSGEGLDGEALGTATTSAPTFAALANEALIARAKVALGDVDPPTFYKRYLTAAKHASPDNLRIAVAKGKLPKSVISSKGTVEKAGLLKNYWGIVDKKNKGKPLTENQQQIYDFFEGAPEVKLTDRGNGIYSFQDTLKSSAKDLGGMNAWGAIDVYIDKVYPMLSDGHDMMGMNPPGGNSLINIVPIRPFDVGTKTKIPKGEKTFKPDMSKIEELTGIKQNKGESPTAYQARVLKDYRGDPTLLNFLRAGENIGYAGMLTGLTGEEREP
jgi:predicted transcriptional regulator